MSYILANFLVFMIFPFIGLFFVGPYPPFYLFWGVGLCGGKENNQRTLTLT